MGNISVNIMELRSVLDATPSTHNIMLVGDHGIGKSEILSEYYKSKGMKVVALFLGQMSDPGDIIGLPNKNEETGQTEFMPPYWFPVDGKPVCLFLDELNRARPEILQTVMDLCLNRKLAGRPLPEGSIVIAAVNEGQKYQLTDLDPALVSRFNVMKFAPTVQEWLLWAKQNQLDERVLSFIEENPIYLDSEPDSKADADTGLDKTPDRRAWKRVSDVIKGIKDLDKAHSKLLSGIVGSKAASQFLANISSRRLVSGKEVCTNFEKVLPKLREYSSHELSTVNDGIYRYLEVEKVKDDMKKTVAANVEKYFDFLAKDKKECAAHFASIYPKNTYPKAVQFLALNAQILTFSMVTYIKSIH